MAESALARFSVRRRTRFPEIQPADIDDLPEFARMAGVLVWQRRHANEQASVRLGERMYELAHTSALPSIARKEIVGALYRLVQDESTHVAVAAQILAEFGAPPAEPQLIRSPETDESPALSFARDTVVGLVICESLSAARFASVRAATDVPVFQKIVSAFLRDEVAHAGLGYLLLPHAVEAVATVLGPAAGKTWILHEISLALVELETSVGLDGERRGLPPPRPQPTPNVGIIEPNLDAHAFYRAVETRILPRLELCGIGVRRAWKKRLEG